MIKKSLILLALVAVLFILQSTAVLFVAAAEEQQENHSPYVTVLTSSNFDQKLKETPFWFIKFYAPWCGHCRQLAPVWADFGAQLETSTGVRVAKVDCTVNSDICDRYHVRGYPTLMFFKDGEPVMEYESSRSITAMQAWVQKLIAPPNFDGSVVDLTDDTFEKTVSSVPNAQWFIKFYSPNCGHCRAMEKTWVDFAREMIGGGVIVAEVNVLNQKELANKFNIERYPTLYLINGRKMVKYDGGRTVDNFKQFALEGWKSKAAVPRAVLTVGPDGFIDQFMMLMQEHPMVFFSLIGVVLVMIVLCVTMIVCLMDGYETEPLKKALAKPGLPPRPQQPASDDNSPTSSSSSTTPSTIVGAEIRSRANKDKDY